MGYEVWGEGQITFKADDQPLMMAALRNLDESGSKGGGSNRGEKWFAFMNNHVDFATKCTTVAEVLECARFDVRENPRLGGVVVLDVTFDGKIGDEDQFLGAIAPWVQEGSHVDWRGEDGEAWRSLFEGARVHQRAGRIVYD